MATKSQVVDVFMCVGVGVCLLQVNGVEELYDFALLEICCDCEGVKLFIAIPLTNSGSGGIYEMFF
jgi:hypothetical protein